MVKSTILNKLHLPIKETLYDITTQIFPLFIDVLHYSLDKTECDNPLIHQLYPNAYSLRLNRNRLENSLGTFQRTVAHYILNTLQFSSINLTDITNYQITSIKEVGQLNLKRIKLKLANKIKLTENEKIIIKRFLLSPYIVLKTI